MEKVSRSEPELVIGEANASRVAHQLPHPLDGQWYINVNDTTHGPYTGHQLRGYIDDGRMQGSTMVLPVGTNAWSRADTDGSLSAYFRPLPFAASPQPAVGPVHAAQGATVVQVTNTIAAPQTAPAVLLDGPAAEKSPFLAALLSLLWCGLGQIYNGQLGKGILMMVVCIALWAVMLGWIINIWSILDAYSRAKAMNRRYLALIASGRAVVA